MNMSMHTTVIMKEGWDDFVRLSSSGKARSIVSLVTAVLTSHAFSGTPLTLRVAVKVK